METKMNIQEKRAYLKELSAPLRALKTTGQIDTINEGLISIYNQQGHKDLKTINQWNKMGKRVNKGETALLLWGSKQKHSLNPSNQNQPAEKSNAEDNQTDDMEFFPLCYVFSNLQVKEVAQ